MKDELRKMPPALVWARVRTLGRYKVLGAPPGAASPAEVAAETDSIMLDLNRYMSYAAAPADFVAGKMAQGTRALADLAAYCYRVGYTEQGQAIETLAESTGQAARDIGAGAGDGAKSFFSGVAEGEKKIVDTFMPVLVLGGVVALIALWSPAALVVGRQAPMVVRALRPV